MILWALSSSLKFCGCLSSGKIAPDPGQFALNKSEFWDLCGFVRTFVGSWGVYKKSDSCGIPLRHACMAQSWSSHHASSDSETTVRIRQELMEGWAVNVLHYARLLVRLLALAFYGNPVMSEYTKPHRSRNSDFSDANSNWPGLGAVLALDRHQGIPGWVRSRDFFFQSWYYTRIRIKGFYDVLYGQYYTIYIVVTNCSL